MEPETRRRIPTRPPMPPRAQTQRRAAPVIDPAEHLRMARGIARGVRYRYGFRAGSQEERELEATAYLVVTEYAPRFDPEKAYRKGARLAIEAACRSWRRRQPAPRCPDRPLVAGADQSEWAASVAAESADRRRFPTGSPERRALVRLARRVAAERAAAFDPAKAFRGWAAREVRSRCERESLRLRNGGTFHTAAKLPDNWQIIGIPCTDDPERHGADRSVREPDVPRQLATADDEYDEDAEWHFLYLRWCLALVESGAARDRKRARSRKTAAGRDPVRVAA